MNFYIKKHSLNLILNLTLAMVFLGGASLGLAQDHTPTPRQTGRTSAETVALDGKSETQAEAKLEIMPGIQGVRHAEFIPGKAYPVSLHFEATGPIEGNEVVTSILYLDRMDAPTGIPLAQTARRRDQGFGRYGVRVLWSPNPLVTRRLVVLRSMKNTIPVEKGFSGC